MVYVIISIQASNTDNKIDFFFKSTDPWNGWGGEQYLIKMTEQNGDHVYKCTVVGWPQISFFFFFFYY